MESSVLATIISSICLLIGTIITVVVTNAKTRTEIEIKQKFQQNEIDEIKKDMKEHNNYAKRLPIIETELTYIKEAIAEIKKHE